MCFLLKATLQCVVSTKRSPILTKSAASSYRFVYVCATFYWTPGTKGLRFKHLHHLPFCHSHTSKNAFAVYMQTYYVQISSAIWRIFYEFLILSESVIRRGSVKKCSQKFCKVHRRTPVPETLRENSEFKILNFTNYEKFYFHCLANMKPKPHTKVLKNLFHNMVLRNLCVATILPSYFSSRET